MAAKVNVPVDIVGGLEGDTHPFLKTKLEKMQNCSISKKGALVKRKGTKKISSPLTYAYNDTQAIGTPATLLPYGDGTLWLAARKCYTLSNSISTSTNGRRVYQDLIPNAVAEFSNIQGVNTETISDTNVAYSNGYLFYTYNNSSSGLMYTVSDAVTGAVITPSTVRSNTKFVTPRTFTVGNYVVIVVGTSSSGNISAYWMNTSTGFGTWVTSNDFITDCEQSSSKPIFDACAYDSTSFLVGYHTTGNVWRIRRYTVGASSLTLSNTYNSSDTATGNPSAIAVASVSGNGAWLAYVTTGAIRVSGCDGSFSETTNGGLGTSTPYEITLAPISNGNVCIIWTSSTGLLCHGVWTQSGSGYTGAGVPSSKFRTTQGNYRLASRALVYNGIPYCMIAGGGVGSSGLLKSLLLVEFDTTTINQSTEYQVSDYVRQPLPVTNVLPRQVTYTSPSTIHTSLSPIVLTSGSTQYHTAGYFGSNQTIYETGGLSVTKLLFDQPFQGAEFNGVIACSGGVPFTFDGRVASEISFIELPDVTSIAFSGTGGGASAGVYQGKGTREYVDKAGNFSVSAPSPSTSNTASATNTATLTFPHTAMTRRQHLQQPADADILNVFYRTSVYSEDFHLVATGGNSVEIVGSQGLVSDQTDTVLLAEPQLYTMGAADGDGRVLSSQAILDNVCPPSSKYLVAHGGRVWLGGTPDDTLWYSKSIVTNEGLAYNEALTLPAFEGGRVSGLGSMDGVLVVFKENTIWRIQGDGNNDAGIGSTLTLPQKISSDVGCIDARSIVSTPIGIVFFSHRGLYLLGRDWSISFIGADVKDLTQISGFSVTSAVMVEDQNQIRFTTNQTYVLVYDWIRNIWSTFHYKDESGNALTFDTACMANGVYNMVTTAGQEYIEDVSGYKDAETTFVPITFETGWLHLAELQGYQRVCRAMLLGEYHTPNTMTMTEYTDYRPFTVNATAAKTNESLTATSVQQIEYGIMVQRSESLKLKFVETAGSPVGTGQGITITGLNLLANVMRGKWRPASSVRGS